MTRDQVVRREALELVLAHPQAIAAHEEFRRLNLMQRADRVAEWIDTGVAPPIKPQ